MLKTRVIPTLLCRGKELVKGQQFVNERRVGNALAAARVHNMRGVDELVILEVGGGQVDFDTIHALAGECFMPLSVGGGVRDMEDFRALIQGGADKVVLGHTNLIAQASQKFGAQAVVYSLAYRGASHPLAMNVTAKHVESLGAGEILLQSIERDGTMQGYDLDVIREVSQAVSIPVIASGGCSGYPDMAEALNAGAHAVAAGALFQFTDATPQGAARWLYEQGFHTRTQAA